MAHLLSMGKKKILTVIPERNIISTGNYIEIFSHRNYDVNFYSEIHSTIVPQVPAPQGHEFFVWNMITTTNTNLLSNFKLLFITE